MAPASLATFKLVAERGLITHLNGRGCIATGISSEEDSRVARKVIAG